MITDNSLLNGRYRMVKKVGQGGFAQVFLATDQLLKRQVAVKVLNSDLLSEDESFLGRFEREAQSIAGLDHSNILGVYDYGQAEDTAYLVMPYVEGGTLHHKLRREKKLSFEVASQYLQQAAAALDYAHRRNIVHRDIKPQNMLLRSEDDRLLLADFGIAKVLGSASTHSNTAVMGTISYMAPEQLNGNVVTVTDIYALGCVLFLMLTGQLPYSGTTEQVITGHMLRPIPSITERIQGNLPPKLQDVIERALAKRPEDRFQTAGEFARAFSAVVASTPTIVQPPSDNDATQISVPMSFKTNPTPPAFDSLDRPTEAMTPSQPRLPEQTYLSGGQINSIPAVSTGPFNQTAPANKAQPPALDKTLAPNMPAQSQSQAHSHFEQTVATQTPPHPISSSVAPFVGSEASPKKSRVPLFAAIGGLVLVGLIALVAILLLSGGKKDDLRLATPGLAAVSATAAPSTVAVTNIPDTVKTAVVVVTTEATATTVPTSTSAPTATTAPTATAGPNMAVFASGASRKGEGDDVDKQAATEFTPGEDVFAFVIYGNGRPQLDSVDTVLVANGNAQPSKTYKVEKDAGILVMPLGKLEAGSYKVELRYNGNLLPGLPEFKVVAPTTVATQAPVVTTYAPPVQTTSAPPPPRTTVPPVPPTPVPRTTQAPPPPKTTAPPPCQPGQC